MLNAILHGKKRGTGLEGLQLKFKAAEGAEDVLTATIFERLSYLPNEVVAQVFANLGCKKIESIDEIEFWPRWDYGGHSVEPDVVIRCGDCSLLVEAKRHDHARQQYPEQLAQELSAGWQEKDRLSTDVILLAVGGLDDYAPGVAAAYKERIQAVPVCHEWVKHGKFEFVCQSWLSLYRALEKALESFETKSSGQNRILKDIAGTFLWHGLRTHPPLWLDELKEYPIRMTAFDWLSDLDPQQMSERLTAKSDYASLGTLIPAWIGNSAKIFDVWRMEQ